MHTWALSTPSCLESRNVLLTRCERLRFVDVLLTRCESHCFVDVMLIRGERLRFIDVLLTRGECRRFLDVLLTRCELFPCKGPVRLLFLYHVCALSHMYLCAVVGVVRACVCARCFDLDAMTLTRILLLVYHDCTDLLSSLPHLGVVYCQIEGKTS